MQCKKWKERSDWLFQIAWYFCTNQIASILVEHSLTSKMTSLHVNEISSGKLRYLVASIHFGAFLFFWALCYFFSSFDNRLWRLFSFQHSSSFGQFFYLFCVYFSFSLAPFCVLLLFWALFPHFGFFYLVWRLFCAIFPPLCHLILSALYCTL